MERKISEDERKNMKYYRWERGSDICTKDREGECVREREKERERGRGRERERERVVYK